MERQVKPKLMPCPECGSGDVRLCRISRRPYCGDCQHWARVNFTGSLEDSIAEWNRRSNKIWLGPNDTDRMRQVKYELEELTSAFIALGTAVIEVGERLQKLERIVEKRDELPD